MFLVIFFVVKNFSLPLHLWSSLQKFSIEKKLFQLCLCETFRYAVSNFPLMNRLSCRYGFLNSFYSQRWFPKKIIHVIPSLSLLPVQNDRCGLQLWSTSFLEKPRSKCRWFSNSYHCPNQLHSTCRGPGGWWKIDKIHPLGTKRFGTCKLCISCL